MIKSIMEEIVFKYRNYLGDKKKKVIKIEMPEFKNYKDSFNGIEFIVTKENQILEFLDNIDKTNLMKKYGMEIVYNYWLYVPKTKSVSIIENAELQSIFNELQIVDLLPEFIEVGKIMKESIANLPIKKQFEIIIASMSVASKAHLAGMDRISKIWDGFVNCQKSIST